jgi:septal ring factor EnvC (AmiA/AmiB activator)
MSKDDSKDFIIEETDDDEYADSLFREEMKDLRVEKLNQRVTIITILIPCLIGVILFIAYRDLTGKVSQSEFSGSKEVQALSDELEENFALLTKQDSEFQAKLAEHIASIEKTTAALNERLKSLDSALKQTGQNIDRTREALKSIDAAKIDKKEQKASIEKINNTLIPIRKNLEELGPMRQDLNKLSAEMKALDENIRKDLTTVSTSVAKTGQDLTQLQSALDQVHTKVSAMDDAKIDRASLDLEILKAKKNLDRTLDQELVTIERMLDGLLKRTRRLETNLKKLEATATKIPGATTLKQGSTEIKEQDLKE